MNANAWRGAFLLLGFVAAIGAASQFQHRRSEWNAICRPYLAWFEDRREIWRVIETRPLGDGWARSDRAWSGTLAGIADACSSASGSPR